MFKDFNLEIELVDEGAKLPTRAHDTDAGCDVYSPIDVRIEPNDDECIPLGWRCRFPKGYGMIMVEKSGRATKNKITVGAKLIDANYRGIVHAHLFNNGRDVVEIKAGEKITQFVMTPVWDGSPIQVDEISTDTDRGEGGFGSSTLN